MKNALTELELYSTTSFQLYGQALDGSQAGSQDYAAVTELKGARIVSEAWLLNLIADYEEQLRKAKVQIELRKRLAIAKDKGTNEVLKDLRKL